MTWVIDHLVLAGPNLAELCDWWATQTGSAPTPGGAHPGLGTRNALVGLGPSTYLELIGPDPQQPAPDQPRPFGVDKLDRMKLVTWATATSDIEASAANVRAAGLDSGLPTAMSRTRPDGVELEWRLSVPGDPTLGGVLPFLIEWGSETPHPAADLEQIGHVDKVRLVHPNAAVLSPVVEALTGWEVIDGPVPRISTVLSIGSAQLVLDSL